MLNRDQKIAIFMEGHAVGQPGKMGHGVIRYSANPLVCVIDSTHAGSDMTTVAGMPRPIPIVADVRAAYEMGAEVLLLGIAPGGGLIPQEWYPAIDEAVGLGMSVLNGLHDHLSPRYIELKEGQWVWDVRTEPEGLVPSTGKALKLTNRRLLMVGTDMSVGKMTAGLEIYRVARERGVRAEFVATGQIGITVTGRGVPLDAIRLDFAGGSIEREVLRASEEADLVIVEGQGSLDHPASSANLPLLRGSMPTHLIMCHRAGQETLFRMPDVHIPPLAHLIRLYEDLASACGNFPRPKTVAVALNTFHIESDEEALAACRTLEDELGLPCIDPVRHGPDRLVDATLA
jgi:uncharacterized NAD-dependent epimerase/dehydratase family protein